MDAEVELGEAAGLGYRSAGSGRPLVLLHPGELTRPIASGTIGSEELERVWLDLVDYRSPAAERVGERFEDVSCQPGPNQHREWGDLETPDRYRPVVARRAEETDS